jgi:hypothetical protein
LLPSGGFLERGVPTLAQHKSNESWNRYHPEDVWNAMCLHSHYTGVMNPGIVTIWRSLERGWPTLALHGINGESAGNYPLINEECTRGRGFWLKLTAHRRGIHPPGRGFHWELLTHLLGFRPVRSKFAENPSTGNNSRISSFKSYTY